jgi:two-component system, chemotaxis family, chemotaxis protein CheY
VPLPKFLQQAPVSGKRLALMSVSMTMPILIVDDYNTMIRIMRNLLRQLGFTNIDEANDGAAALAKMRNKDYALVISDSHMSPMTGMEFLQRVRAEERIAQTPFVMVANDNAEGAEAQGASTYIVKPFSAQALKSTLVPVIGAF